MCGFYCRFCTRAHTSHPLEKGLWAHLKRTCSSTTSILDESVLTAWSRDNNNFYCVRLLNYCSFGILLATLSLSQILQVIFIQKSHLLNNQQGCGRQPSHCWWCLRCWVTLDMHQGWDFCLPNPFLLAVHTSSSRNPDSTNSRNSASHPWVCWPPLEPAAKHFSQGRSNLMSTEVSQQWRTWRHKLFL